MKAPVTTVTYDMLWKMLTSWCVAGLVYYNKDNERTKYHHLAQNMSPSPLPRRTALW